MWLISVGPFIDPLGPLIGFGLGPLLYLIITNLYMLPLFCLVTNRCYLLWHYSWENGSFCFVLHYRVFSIRSCLCCCKYSSILVSLVDTWKASEVYVYSYRFWVVIWGVHLVGFETEAGKYLWWSNIPLSVIFVCQTYRLFYGHVNSYLRKTIYFQPSLLNAVG